VGCCGDAVSAAIAKSVTETGYGDGGVGFHLACNCMQLYSLHDLTR